MGDVSIKMYDKFGHVLRIESTCNDVGTFRVKRKVEHRNGSSSEQKAPLKKSIYSLYQLFTIMKAANYRYLEFISSFDDHSDGNSSLTKVTSPVSENERSYRGINFFSECDLRILEIISRGGIIEHIKGTYKYFPTAYGKEVIAAGLAVRNLVLIPALA